MIPNFKDVLFYIFYIAGNTPIIFLPLPSKDVFPFVLGGI
jgi:hypothetical protein